MTSDEPLIHDGREIPSVSELSQRIKEALQIRFSSVWVCGEISDLSRPQSGHMYFTLKDAGAQIRGVIWRTTAARIKFPLEDGMEVICSGSIDLYPPRGSYQLIVKKIEQVGAGAMQQALKRLRAKLEAEGLFDPAHKQPLPVFPKKIAVVTSPTGAAIRDFLQVALRRWRGVEILVVPVRVQGDGSAFEIAEAIRQCNEWHDLDAIVVTRGGGSMEDLWGFNDEKVVRAIFASRIPVVSAVGHEIDVTLSDLVADLRALTPTEAAERVIPAGEDLRGYLHRVNAQIHALMRSRLEAVQARVDGLALRPVLRDPCQMVYQLSCEVDDLQHRIHQAARGRVLRGHERVGALAGKLDSLSPLSVLGRGYSLTQNASGELVRNASDVSVGERITTRLPDGQIISRVEE